MKYIILGHQNPDVDSILSGILLERIFTRNIKSDSFKFIIPDDTIDELTKKIISNLGIDINDYKDKTVDELDQIILVDHYEDTRYNNRICAIYDHHPITSNLNYFENVSSYHLTKSCSTTTIIYNMFNEYITKDEFILVLVGALVDTVSFNSDKTNYEEVELLKKKCEEYGYDINNYLEIGLCLNNLDDLNKIYLNGLKKHVLQDKKVESSYIQIKDIDKNNSKIEAIISMLTNYLNQEKLDIFVFIVHDMDNFKSIAYKITKEGITIDNYDSYTSRSSIIANLNQELLEKKTTRV